MQSRHIERAAARARRHILGLAIGLAVVAPAGGCSQPQEPGPEARQAAPAKRAPERGTAVEQTVRWPARSSLDEAARQGLSAKARAIVDRAPLPVLAVARPELLEAATVMAKEAWVALSARGDGVTVSLSASRVAYRYPRTPRAEGSHRVRGHSAFVTQNEGIWSAAWVEGGVAYSLEVECATPSDARCADAGYLMGLAEDLRYVGGAGAEGTP